MENVRYTAKRLAQIVGATPKQVEAALGRRDGFSPEMVEAWTAAGTPEQCVEHLNRTIELHVLRQHECRLDCLKQMRTRAMRQLVNTLAILAKSRDQPLHGEISKCSDCANAPQRERIRLLRAGRH